MGLLSWFFPSPEQRVERARKELARGLPEEARLEVLDVDLPAAREVLAEAENALALRNLAAALQSVQAGDDVRGMECLELAERFHHGGHEEAFRDARRQMRELRASRTAEAEAAKADAQRRALSMDPLGMTGGPSWLDRTVDPAAFGEDADELQARLALVVESYPEALKPTVAVLGESFTHAILDLDEGRADLALQALVALPDDQPLVHWERARAAYALGDPAAAARSLRRFAELAGHATIGERHTATFLAQCLAESGDVPGALRVMRSARADAPKLGPLLFANLLEATGELEEAEQVLRQLVKDAPKLSAAYVALARVRVAGGHRPEAMRALEASLQACACAPGTCGAQPPDLDAHRMLAILYLEDGLERDRALELADTAMGLVRQPVWADLYLAALSSRAQGRPDTKQLVDKLVQVTPQGTPAADRVAALLG